MDNRATKGILERGAPSDLWRNTLSRIPTLFGKIMYLASVRGPETGRYEHHGLALLFGEKAADTALRRSHEECFAHWLELPLEQQKADLDEYLASHAAQRRIVVDNWLRLAPYRTAPPASARASEKRLFVADFEALLLVLKAEYGVDVQDQDA